MSEPTTGRWDQFWFQPCRPGTVARVRVALSLVSCAYFLSAWPDVSRWYGQQATLSADNAATFLQLTGLEDQARWVVSPLFLTNETWAYHGYLLLGAMVSLVVVAGRGGRAASFLLWALVVGWANRSLMLSSLGESILSLGLFSAAIAKPTSVRSVFSSRACPSDAAPSHWTNRFSQVLLAGQITVIGYITFATMLAGRLWWNGLGAYALAAPVEDRTIDWSNSILVQPLVHDSVTLGILLGLPIGVTLGWSGNRYRVGIAVIVIWCLTVAALGSHWLYASSVAALALIFDGGRRR